MFPEPGSLLLLCALGGLVAVDGTSFGQFMISRPFVAATFGGWIVGAPMQGAAIGVVLEAFHLTVLPVGAARYPEGGPAAVAGGAVYAMAAPSPNGLLLIVLTVLALEWIGGESVRFMRHGNVRLVSDDHGPPTSARSLEWRHGSAIGVDFARGMALVALGLGLLGLVQHFVAPFWGLEERFAQILLAALVPGLIASTIRMVGWRGWFAAAGAIGGIALVTLGS